MPGAPPMRVNPEALAAAKSVVASVVKGVEHTGTNVFEALERPDAAELYAKAVLVHRVQEIMDQYEGTERARFKEIADEILEAVRAYHG